MPRVIAPLAKDVACRANMMWATRLDPSVSADAFLQIIEAQGFTAGQGAIPGLAVFDHDDTGHRVIYIPRTGRIQIRLDALTRHEERVDEAHRLYDIVRLAALRAGDPDAAHEHDGDDPVAAGSANDADEHGAD